jgi:hypothetical protein
MWVAGLQFFHGTLGLELGVELIKREGLNTHIIAHRELVNRGRGMLQRSNALDPAIDSAGQPIPGSSAPLLRSAEEFEMATQA